MDCVFTFKCEVCSSPQDPKLEPKSLATLPYPPPYQVASSYREFAYLTFRCIGALCPEQIIRPSDLG